VTSAFGELLRACEELPHRTALQDEHRIWRFADLLAHAHGAASALAAQGLGPGDRLVVLAKPSLDLVAAMLGAYLRGVVWVPVNPSAPAPEVEHILQDCRPALLLCDATTRATLPAAIGCAIAALDGVGGLPSLQSHGEVPVTPSPVADDETALLIYTSGTTGRSKGVRHSHETVVRGIGALTRAWEWTGDDVLSLMLPLFHVHGLCIGVHGALLHGMKILLRDRFDPAAVLADFETRGATVFMGVPTMYTRLLRHLESAPDAAKRLAGARLFTCGSAALAAADLHRFEALTGHRILERYGMSETLITVSNPYRGDRRAGSIGLPIPGVETRVLDDEGAEVEGETPGELAVRAEAMMLGYWNNPEATVASFDPQGWFRTGDIVTRDEDGYLRIVGRRSVDIIKSGGFKVGAREVEDVLRSHPELADIAVFGTPDAEWGERVTAAVVLRPSAPKRSSTELVAELRAFAAAMLSDYKTPRRVVVLDALPRNALGKVQKAELKRQFGGEP